MFSRQICRYLNPSGNRIGQVDASLLEAKTNAWATGREKELPQHHRTYVDMILEHE